MIARLRAGAEAVERGELDAEDFAGIWSQYLRELFRRASSVLAPADVRKRVAKEVYLWEATRFGADESWALRRWREESNTRRELYFNVADRILALLRTPRGEGCRMVDETYCATHDCGAHDDEKCGRPGCQHCDAQTVGDRHRLSRQLLALASVIEDGGPSNSVADDVRRAASALVYTPPPLAMRQVTGRLASLLDADADWLHDGAMAGRLPDRCQAVAERIRAALRYEAQGEERASKYGALLAFADAISDAVWGGERAWEQDGGLERLAQKVRRWAKERAARRSEGGE